MKRRLNKVELQSVAFDMGFMLDDPREIDKPPFDLMLWGSGGSDCYVSFDSLREVQWELGELLQGRGWEKYAPSKRYLAAMKKAAPGKRAASSSV